MNPKRLFFFLLYLWIAIAFFNLIYNSAKSVSEVREWIFLTDNQKREKVFGDEYIFLRVVENHTPKDAKILTLSNERVMMILLSRYYLYPRLVSNTNDKSDLMKFIKSKNYSYLAVYNYKIAPAGYKQIASYTSKNSRDHGYLLKKE